MNPSPTGMVAMAVFVAVVKTDTEFAPALVGWALVPPAVIATLTGSCPTSVAYRRSSTPAQASQMMTRTKLARLRKAEGTKGSKGCHDPRHVSEPSNASAKGFCRGDCPSSNDKSRAYERIPQSEKCLIHRSEGDVGMACGYLICW